jgi:hypothetical protein
MIGEKLMIPELINENLSGKTGSYFLPFIWYTGESKTLIAQEI